MRCKPTDMAYIVDGPFKTYEGVVVEVLSAYLTHPIYGPTWRCHSKKLLPTLGRGFQPEAHIPDAWLRPISGVPLADETPIETNVPEALKLALGIESRSWA
jgi:hypothetical protein